MGRTDGVSWSGIVQRGDLISDQEDMPEAV
jgi:hypothetical protein